MDANVMFKGLRCDFCYAVCFAISLGIGIKPMPLYSMRVCYYLWPLLLNDPHECVITHHSMQGRKKHIDGEIPCTMETKACTAHAAGMKAKDETNTFRGDKR